MVQNSAIGAKPVERIPNQGEAAGATEQQRYATQTSRTFGHAAQHRGGSVPVDCQGQRELVRQGTESVEKDEEPELVQRAVSGDAKALELLLARHAPAMFRLASVLMQDQATAADVTQQALLAAFRGIGKFRADSSLRTWLLTITRNAVYRVQSRRATEEPMAEPLAQLGLEAGWGGGDPETLAIRAQHLESLKLALESLAPTDREVLMLRDVEQLRGVETADVLGLDLAAMKSRLHRARLRLAAALRQQRRAASFDSALKNTSAAGGASGKAARSVTDAEHAVGESDG